MPQNDSLISSREAMAILGYTHPSSIARLVYAGKLTPERQIGGKHGTYLFARDDVEQFGIARAAELRAEADRLEAAAS